MNLVRNILAVVVGYLIFAVAAVLFFNLSGIDPHAETGPFTKAVVVFFGSAFALAGGYVGKLIGANKTLIPNVIIASIIAIFAATSLVLSPGTHYTQMAAIVFFAPFSLIGGWLRRRSEI